MMLWLAGTGTSMRPSLTALTVVVLNLLMMLLAVAATVDATLPHTNGWTFSRGGQQQRVRSSTTTVSRPPILSIGIIADNDSPQTLVALQSHEASQQTVLSSMEAICLVSDVLIVEVTKTSQLLPASILDAMYLAATRRTNAGVSSTINKLRIVVVVEHSEDFEEIRNRIALNDLQHFTPDILQSLDIVPSVHDAKTIVSTLVQQQNQHPVIDVESRIEYDMVLKQVHEHFTKEPFCIDWKDTDEWSTTMMMNATTVTSNNNDNINNSDSSLSGNHPHTPVKITPSPSNTHHHKTEITTSRHQDIILQQVKTQLDDLEEQQEQIWIQNNIPLLHFGTQANQILINAKDQLPENILLQVATQLASLYHTQLNTLREHYGRKYETILDTQTQETWTDAAAKITQDFRTAAQHAIPEICQQGDLADADFSYVSSLHGLVSDMMEATEARISDEEQELDEDDLDAIHHRPIKWYEKFAARAVVLGVNYFQGWLAWQGIKRAAADRDREMPKFPLF